MSNTLWRAGIIAGAGPIDVVHLGLPGGAAPTHVTRASGTPRTMEEAEREAIRSALTATADNRTQAAKVLGIARSTLLEKLKKYGLD